MSCPHCHEPVPTGSNFCEACGRPVDDAATASTTPVDAAVVEVPGASAPDVSGEAAPIDAGTSAVTSARRAAGAAGATDPSGTASTRPCLECGGVVGDDGYCGTCGAKAPSERDHFREQPASWVAAVSDRGIAHHRNEDAMAVLATPDAAAAERRAVLVVLDGVSRTDDSSVGSLAGARAALTALAAPLPRGMGTTDGRGAVAAHALTEAARVADEQVVAATTPGTTRPASATFTVAVLEGDTVFHANIGDSRCYWLPDGGPGVQLTRDDSAAQIQIMAGVPRAEAESSPQAHAITGWLGSDSPSIVPTVGSVTVTGPGWLVACSDGLWNYASDPDALAAQVTAATAATAATADGSADPAAVALALVAFANASGGQDNITVALARLPDPSDATAPTGPSTTQIGEADG